MLPILLLAAALQTPISPAGAQDTATYLDPGARTLVEGARAYRSGVDQSLESYRALARGTIDVGVRAAFRDRVLFRCQDAVRVEWRRDGQHTMEVLGARQAAPLISRDVSVPDAPGGCGPSVLFDPGGDRLEIAGVMGGSSADSSFLRHPLAPSNQSHYRFRSGDTTRIGLPDGSEVILLELRIIPRSRSYDVVSGSLWLESERLAVVQALLRPARPVRLLEDLSDEEDVEDIPEFLRSVEGEIRLISVEYALWEQRWWLPRRVVLEGVVRAGRLLRVPMTAQRVYREFEVSGDMAALAAPLPEDSAALGVEDDPVLANAERGRARCQAPEGTRCFCSGGTCELVQVLVPEDTLALLSDEHLPVPIFSDDDVLFGESELDQLRERTETLRERLEREAPSLRPELRPSLAFGWSDPRLLRYNRVEQLSVGARGTLERGRRAAALTLRLDTEDFDPLAELELTTERAASRLTFGAYHRLATVERGSSALRLGNSLNALVFGRDDGEYFRASGAELTGRPTGHNRRDYEWRVFAERQRATEGRTDFSIRHMLQDEHVFRENMRASRASQVGASGLVRLSRGLDPRGLRLATELFAEASTGTFDFFRPSLTARANFSLPAGLVGAVEASAGASTGAVPPQSSWLLGGPTSLRGYPVGVVRGDSFWRGRVEVGTGLPAIRATLFSDVGWAGSRDEFAHDDPLASVGIGIGTLDGLLRVDVARALRAPTGWRADFYVDGIM